MRLEAIQRAAALGWQAVDREPLARSPGEQTRSLEDTLGRFLRTAVPRVEGLLVKRIWSLGGEALGAMAQARPHTARIRIGEARLLLQGSLSDPACAQLARASIDPIDALAEYRASRFETARSLLASAVEADLALERSHGLDELALHRVQLAHNWIRTAWAEGALELACRYAARLLGRCLAAQAPTALPPEEGAYAQTSLAAQELVPSASRLLEDLASHGFGEPELARLTSWRLDEELEGYLAGPSGLLGEGADGWLRLQVCASDEGLLQSERLIPLLSREREVSDSLWFALLEQVRGLLRRAENSPDARALATALDDYHR